VSYGGLLSFKVIEIGTNRKPACDFLLVFHCIYVTIFYRFRDIAISWLKISDLRRLLTPVSFEALTTGVSCDLRCERWSQKSLSFSVVKSRDHVSMCRHMTCDGQTSRGKSRCWSVCLSMSCSKIAVCSVLYLQRLQLTSMQLTKNVNPRRSSQLERYNEYFT